MNNSLSIKKELTLTEIQKVSLGILKQVHTFCISNGIRYSLAYGTLIGAIRHHGFIPWDDDIDIIMPRPDYDRFCHSFHAKGCLHISEFDPKCHINYCKVFDTENTICTTLAPFSSYTCGGVNIDIFPADAVSDNFDCFVKDVKEQYHRWRKQIRYRSSLAPFHMIIQAKYQKIDLAILLFIKVSMLGKILLKRENDAIRKKNSSYSWNTTNHWSQMVFLDDGYRNYQSIDIFNRTIEMSFEGQNFFVMSGYDSFLKSLYGDYLALPPIEKRIPKHKQTSYYWK